MWLLIRFHVSIWRVQIFLIKKKKKVQIVLSPCIVCKVRSVWKYPFNLGMCWQTVGHSLNFRLHIGITTKLSLGKHIFYLVLAPRSPINLPSAHSRSWIKFTWTHKYKNLRRLKTLGRKLDFGLIEGITM